MLFKSRPCVHCGRLCGDFDGGYASVGDAQLCHPNAPGRPDCYFNVTISKHNLHHCVLCTPFYEDDEPIADVLAAFEGGEHGTTGTDK